MALALNIRSPRQSPAVAVQKRSRRHDRNIGLSQRTELDVDKGCFVGNAKQAEYGNKQQKHWNIGNCPTLRLAISTFRVTTHVHILAA